jgi:FkbM family methyltransferase
MTVSEWVFFKYYAALTLGRMIRWLSNWREVWSAYRASRQPPPLRFRDGFTLHHGRLDSPVSLLREVFGERHYRRHIESPLDGVMIDIGANIGAVTLDWASRSGRLHIHAYEPNPATYSVLQHNVEANGLTDRVTMHQEAVGRESGRLRLWTNVHSMTATAYSDAPPTPEAIATYVPLVDLNEVVRRAGGQPIALLKIDTEGGEADALEGATPATLESLRQVILEYHDKLCPNASGRCRRVLEEAGFRCLVRPMNANHGLIYARRNGGRAGVRRRGGEDG